MKKENGLPILATLVITAAMILASGCKTVPATLPEIKPDPFTCMWGLGEKQVVTFSGYSAGHVAGETSEFTLKLDNRSVEERLHGEYCVLLLDRNGIVMEIAHEEFDIPAGLETQKSVTVQFRANLDGPYGLSILILNRGQSISTIWIGEKPLVSPSPGPWPILCTCPKYLTEEGSHNLAEEYVLNSPTFTFDGIEGSLELVETLYPDIENAWQFVFQFESRHAGYGDRTGEPLLQVITPHEAIVTVEQGEVISAIMDSKWDMLKQSMIVSNLEGVTWLLTSYTRDMGTHKAIEDTEVTLIFNSQENQLGGVAGCNHYGAPYKINGSELTLTDSIIQTEMLCDDEIMEQEAKYLWGLQAAENFAVHNDRLTITGGEWILEFEKQQ